MHRSGTSLLGGILQRLGVELPGESIVGDRHNPDGYFEWDEVVQLQERLLIDLQRWWPSEQGTLPLPSDWRQHPATQKTYPVLLALLSSVVERQNCLWAIKDPRCSRLLPLWIDLCAELHIPLRLVLAVRDPCEVVTSLVNRDGPTVGMDSLRAQRLWWLHNLEPISVAQEIQLPLVLVDFELWFKNPQYQLELLEQALPELCPSEVQRKNALDLINPLHRRSQSSISLQPSVRRLYRRLLRHPLPKRWPSPQPPFFSRALTAPSSPLPNGHVEDWNSWLKSRVSFPAPRLTTNLQLHTEFQISVSGSTWYDLHPHLSLQRLPLPGLGNCLVDFERSGTHQLFIENLDDTNTSPSTFEETVERITLNFELPEPERVSHWLNHLKSQHLIFDPEPSRVLLMRELGLPAWWLDHSESINGWLHQAQAVSSPQWAARLGLTPPPTGQLLVLGSAGSSFELALANETSSLNITPDETSALPIAYWPGWFDLVLNDPASSLLCAGWLQAAAERAARLVIAAMIPARLACII